MTLPSKKRTTGPKNDAMRFIVDVDRDIRTHSASNPAPLSEVRYLKKLRSDYVRTIEEKEV